MAVSLQRAGMWKRISAFLFDAILLGILAVLFAFLFSSILGYDRYVDTLNRAYETYGEKYGVDFQTSLSQYDSMTEEERQQLEEAYRAVGQDEEAAYAYQMTIRLTILMVSLGILLACLIWEVLIPALLKDGQTVGKKIFSLGVMRSDGVRLGGVQSVCTLHSGQVHRGDHDPRIGCDDAVFRQRGSAGNAADSGTGAGERLPVPVHLRPYAHS